MEPLTLFGILTAAISSFETIRLVKRKESAEKEKIERQQYLEQQRKIYHWEKIKLNKQEEIENKKINKQEEIENKKIIFSILVAIISLVSAFLSALAPKASEFLNSLVNDCPSNVVCESGKRQPVPGYDWVGLGTKSVAWSVGKTHPTYLHIITSKEENLWQPEPGYKWESSDKQDLRYDNENLNVSWSSGAKHPDIQYAVASSEEGLWEPQDGYVVFDSSNSSNNIKLTSNKLKSPYVSIEKKGIIQKIRTEKNVYQNDEKGMQIHVKFSVRQLKNCECQIAGYFYNATGEHLKDKNGVNVNVTKDFKPRYDRSRFNDFRLFIPYSKLNLQSPGEYNLKYQFELREFKSDFDFGDYKPFAESRYYDFNFIYEEQTLPNNNDLDGLW